MISGDRDRNSALALAHARTHTPTAGKTLCIHVSSPNELAECTHTVPGVTSMILLKHLHGGKCQRMLGPPESTPLSMFSYFSLDDKTRAFCCVPSLVHFQPATGRQDLLFAGHSQSDRLGHFLPASMLSKGRSVIAARRPASECGPLPPSLLPSDLRR